VVHLHIKEGVNQKHFSAHVVLGPFQDLWSGAGKERARGPSAECHCFGCGDVVDEQGHGSPKRTDLFPTLCESNPKVAFPPKEEHVVHKMLGMQVCQ
jgi:hypothetical protein